MFWDCNKATSESRKKVSSATLNKAPRKSPLRMHILLSSSMSSNMPFQWYINFIICVIPCSKNQINNLDL